MTPAGFRNGVLDTNTRPADALVVLDDLELFSSTTIPANGLEVLASLLDRYAWHGRPDGLV
jgi:hypothetical protein